jgi:hypothetical protein
MCAARTTTRDLIRRNRVSARTWDWTPDDFGAADFDGYLIENVRLFQRDRFLPESGHVDRRTVEALHAYRQGIRDGLPNVKRDRNLRELGSVSRYDPDDPRVVRSAPFAGRTLYLVHPSPLAEVGKFLDRWDALAMFGQYLGLPPLDSNLRELRRLCLFPADLSQPFKSGREAQHRATDCEPDGLIVLVHRNQNHLIEQHQGDPLVDFLESMGDPGCPVAIMADLSWPGRRNRVTCRAWNVCEAFDATLPMFPGAMVGNPTEYAIGQIVAWWSIFGKIRPSFCFPVFDTSESEGDLTPNHVHRFRAWVEHRGLRGVGWHGSLSGDLWDALIKPLPSDVPRVDY